MSAIAETHGVKLVLDPAELDATPAAPSLGDWKGWAKCNRAVREALPVLEAHVSDLGTLLADLRAELGAEQTARLAAEERIRVLEIDAALATTNLTPARRAILRRMAIAEKPVDIAAWLADATKGM